MQTGRQETDGAAAIRADLARRVAATGYVRAAPLARTRAYRVVEFVGRWSMLDVFVVTLTVALVRGGRVIANLAVQQDTPRTWRPSDVLLFEDLAERTWALLERRRSEHVRAPHAKGSERGYARLFVKNVLQADKGCDFGFLRRRPD